MNKKLKCIMLIDDDEPTNFLSSMIIEEAGCTEHIQIEDSGEKAINYLVASENSTFDNETHPWPELIFLDINMPAMNGWEFLAKYRDIVTGRKNKVIIIMLTTSLNPDDTIKSIQIPAVSGFEIKPLTPELLNRVITKYFNFYNHPAI